MNSENKSATSTCPVVGSLLYMERMMMSSVTCRHFYSIQDNSLTKHSSSLRNKKHYQAEWMNKSHDLRTTMFTNIFENA